VKSVSIPVAIAAVLWGLMFGLQYGEFWLQMTLSASLLAGIALWFQRDSFSTLYCVRGSDMMIGLVSAAVLYGVFFIGDRVSAYLFSFAAEQVGTIYGMKAGSSPVLISLLLLIVGPAEEVFWRGHVQVRLSDRFGSIPGWLMASLVYAIVHVWSGNFMLVMAALVCGLFWGALYHWRRSIIPGIISHAVWDVVVFIILPIR
jgi:CAAX protease family protein